MPTGPQAQKRSADAIGCAEVVGRTAMGELQAPLKLPSGKVRSRQAGARARAANLTAEQRTAVPEKAAARRWA